MQNINLSTEDKLEYKFFKNPTGFFQFRIRASNDAHIALCRNSYEGNPMYEVFIGGWGNTKSVIRKNRSKPDVAEVSTKGYLNKYEYRGFWIKYHEGHISVGCDGEEDPFLSWRDNERVDIQYVGVCTGWGASGQWILTLPKTHEWVPARNGQLPENAFVGGNDRGNTMYISRSYFKGSLTPGKLLCHHGHALIPWGGLENACPEYEVLCNFDGYWCKTNGPNIPKKALIAGESESGEKLYVGRVFHNNTLTVGKVQPSHGVLYIPYGEKEVRFSHYEILCK